MLAKVDMYVSSFHPSIPAPIIYVHIFKLFIWNIVPFHSIQPPLPPPSLSLSRPTIYIYIYTYIYISNTQPRSLTDSFIHSFIHAATSIDRLSLAFLAPALCAHIHPPSLFFPSFLPSFLSSCIKKHFYNPAHHHHHDEL